MYRMVVIIRKISPDRGNLKGIIFPILTTVLYIIPYASLIYTEH